MTMTSIEVGFYSDPPATKEGLIEVYKALPLSKGERTQIAIGRIVSSALTVIGGITLGVVVSRILGGPTVTNYGVFFLSGFAAVLFVCVFQIRHLLYNSRAMSRTRWGRSKITICFDADGFSSENEHGTSRVKWSGVEDVVLGKDGLSLLVWGGVTAIPRSALQDADAVLAQLNTWRSA